MFMSVLVTMIMIIGALNVHLSVGPTADHGGSLPSGRLCRH